MTMEEYLDFLDQYWDIFQCPEEREVIAITNALL